jgi:hypothetical protein
MLPRAILAAIETIRGNAMELKVLARVLTGLLAALATGFAGAAFAQEPVEQPHLLDCSVKDTFHLTQDGNLVQDQPLPPGARAVGRVTSFLVDTATGVVRMPGQGTVAWVVAKGDATTPELILTPGRDLVSATTVSIHINRRPNNAWFVFFETERVMSGTCVLLP